MKLDDTFMAGYVLGDLRDDDIDDWVDRWHNLQNTPGYMTKLHEYLGMTEIEYLDWLAKRRTLKQIVVDREPKRRSLVVRVFDCAFWWTMRKLLP